MDRDRTTPFFVAITKAGPLLSDIDAAVEALEDNKPEKHHFRALVGLAKASVTTHRLEPETSELFIRRLWQRLVETLHVYRCVYHH